jgi:hypothetical protein
MKTISGSTNPIPTVLPKKSATEVFNQFLSDNNMVLVTSPLADSVKLVSDGSLVITKPEITVRYK